MILLCLHLLLNVFRLMKGLNFLWAINCIFPQFFFLFTIFGNFGGITEAWKQVVVQFNWLFEVLLQHADQLSNMELSGFGFCCIGVQIMGITGLDNVRLHLV